MILTTAVESCKDMPRIRALSVRPASARLLQRVLIIKDPVIRPSCFYYTGSFFFSFFFFLFVCVCVCFLYIYIFCVCVCVHVQHCVPVGATSPPQTHTLVRMLKTVRVWCQVTNAVIDPPFKLSKTFLLCF